MAFFWGCFAVRALQQARTVTGTICPDGWEWKPFTLCAQVAICLLDATILVSLFDLLRLELEETADLFNFISPVLLTGALCVIVVSFPTLLHDSRLFWAFCPHLFDVIDLAIDSLLSAVVVICGIRLLDWLHPSAIALLISSISLFGYHLFHLGPGLRLPLQSLHNAVGPVYAAGLTCALLFYFTLYHETAAKQPTPTVMRHCFIAFFIGVCVLSQIFSFLSHSSPSIVSAHQAIAQLVVAADATTQKWTNQAAKSKSLDQAIVEYERRYGVPPPPNFDKWYDFAISNNSPVIDDFDQIHQDVLPFWGIEPAEIREKTEKLLAYSSLGMGGLRIRNGTVEQSPYISGSHKWMMDALEGMIGPFSKWLPDMDLAINLADECRVSIPYQVMQAAKAQALSVRDRMMEGREGLDTRRRNTEYETQWPTDFTEPAPAEVAASDFSKNGQWQLYYDLVAPTCPPDSAARHKRWWDWSTTCLECVTPHSILTDRGLLVANSTLSNNLCHQPDLAYLDGFLLTPSGAMVGTNKLYPIFSQSRVGGFSDIMIPSPWNFDQKSRYEEDTDMSWDEKTDSLFWRGSSSDGYAAFGSWTGFLRARFIHEAYEKSIQDSDNAGLPLINVSFAGEMSKCHQADCEAELDSFRTWAYTTKSTDHASLRKQSWFKSIIGGNGDAMIESLASQFTPFKENWRYRHLLDMDGAGFSGRFLPFLKSRSLIYRAALFHSWFDERLTAWHHYIPVDVRLGEGFWGLLNYFSGTSNGDAEGLGNAQRIANQGREWAQKALRTEDMQIYMFRLLLEWGRVVDDDRTSLRYS